MIVISAKTLWKASHLKSASNVTKGFMDSVLAKTQIFAVLAIKSTRKQHLNCC